MNPSEIRELRKQHDETQEQFAERVGVVVRTVAGWEAGTTRPSRMALRQLERIVRETPRKGRT